MSRIYDTSGRIITRKITKRSMSLSLIGGAACSIWFIFNAPQQILTLLIKNTLGASSTQLGLFIGILNAASIFHLVSIIIYARSKAVKPVWLTFGVLHRSLSFVIGAALFYAASGGSKHQVLLIVLTASVVTFMLSNCGSSGWWAWINGLIPSGKRSSYFAKRSAVAQTLNVITFLSVTFALNHFTGSELIVFGIIYTAAGVFGELEVILHLFIPEPAGTITRREKPVVSQLLEPLADRNFLRFCIIAGGSLLAVNISAPFFVPMITDPEIIGAPVIWIGIMYAVSQFVWVIVIPFWGTLMDRFGTKPVTKVGMLYPLSFIGYIFLNDQNYTIMLPVIAAAGGAFAPALYEGLNQMMMSLLPEKNRTSFTGWYWGLLGSITALGSILGGFLLDRTGSLPVIIAGSIAGMLAAFFSIGSVKTGKDARFSSILLTATSPSVLKSYRCMPILGKSTDSRRVERIRQAVRDDHSMIVLEEITMRLEDADEDVREEAVRALGRIGSDQSAAVLIGALSDENSLVRSESARALGKMRRTDAVPALIGALSSGDPALTEVAARALGRIDSPQSSEALAGLIRGEYSLKIKVSSAVGLSERQERISYLQESLKLYSQTHNRVIHKQIAISIANSFGRPGEFYRFITGTEDAREDAVQRLFRQVYKNLKAQRRTSYEIISHIVKNTLPQAVSAFEAEAYTEAFEILRTILLQLIFRHIDMIGEHDSLSSEELDRLYQAAPNLYGGYVTMQWFRDHHAPDTAYSDIEVLLLFSVLRWYHRPKET